MGKRRALAPAVAVVGGALFCAAIALPFLTSTTGCQLAVCQGTVNPPANVAAPSGELITGHSWESSPMDGDWTDLKGEDTQIWDISKLVLNPNLGPLQVDYLRANAVVTVYVSPDKNWFNTAGSNFALASGNIAEITALWPGYAGPPVPNGIQPGDPISILAVFNATCAEYYYRVVIEVPELDDAGTASLDASTAGDSSDASAADAGDSATASTADAGTD